eukprot:UN00925
MKILNNKKKANREKPSECKTSAVCQRVSSNTIAKHTTNTCKLVIIHRNYIN